MIQKIFANII